MFLLSIQRLLNYEFLKILLCSRNPLEKVQSLSDINHSFHVLCHVTGVKAYNCLSMCNFFLSNNMQFYSNDQMTAEIEELLLGTSWGA